MARSAKAHQRLSRRALLPAGLLAVLLAVLPAAVLLGACSGSDEPEVVVIDNSGEPWSARGNTCVRESQEGPVRRVVNRVDPELCGRTLKHRPPVYVRVLPPPGMRSR